MFEKSATELKQSKLLKCKQTLQIATFNVRILNRIGQLPELIASAEEHKIDIICIQEHRYTHTEDIKYHETGNGWSLATVSAWKNSVNAAVGGVGLLIGPRALKTLNSIEKIQPRMMVATFNGNPRATIVSCYSPTNVSEENEIVTFYDELSSLVRSIPKHNMLVIGGDLNAQIGKNGNNKYSLHNTSNRNGQHLTDFMIENRLACLNTNYQKREGKLWTYTYANNTKAQIDYVLINKKWKKIIITMIISGKMGKFLDFVRELKKLRKIKVIFITSIIANVGKMSKIIEMWLRGVDIKWRIDIIIIMSCHQHRYPWPFLAPRFSSLTLYHPLLPADLQGYILYRHRAAVCRF